MHKFAVNILVLLLPFNGLKPLLNIGELSQDGFFYGSLMYLALTAPLASRSRGAIAASFALIFRSQYIYILVIFSFLFINLGIISGNQYGSRFGLERFSVSSFTYFYYFLFSTIFVFHAITLGMDKFISRLSNAFILLGVFLSAFCAFEVITWYSEPLRAVYVGFRSVFAASPDRVLFRISGVSFEPSFNAFALLACLPWALLRSHQTRKRRYLALSVFLVTFCILSGARTAYVGLAAMAIMLPLTRGFLKQVLPLGLDGASFVLGMFAVGIALPLFGFADLDPQSSTSDITRSFMMKTAIDSGLANFWGQGFGQVGFYVVQQSSPIIQRSWELIDFFEGSRYGVLPPLFSWYARTFGEFGIVGYTLIAISFAASALRLFRAGHRITDPTTRSLYFLSTTFLSQMLAIALSIESVRIPQFWMTWIFIALFIFERKRHMLTMTKEDYGRT